MATGKGPGVQVPVSWVGTEEIPIVFINNFLGQVDDKGDVILSFGHYTLPALVGTPDEVMKQAERIAYVPVKPIARFTLSRPRLLELVDTLQKTLEVQQTVRAGLRQSGLGDNL
jgi:hypothetical protein